MRRFLTKSNGEMGILTEFCAPGATFHIGATPVGDLQAFQQYLVGFHPAFPDSQITMEDMVAEGDRVAFRGVVRATLTAEFMGIPASGEQIVVPVIGIAHIDDGRIAEWWNSPDRLSRMQQIGAVKV